ncbi:MAG: sensor histidine kinase N-terminal domain-containing protein [Betaproteobacteria bacterium]|nr:sensor histidine kinase N-terminal domain-containing protein [Betaproteobacteria bacterium]
MTETPLSLRSQLINWLFTPLFILFLFSLISGYVVAITSANRPFDRALLQRAQSLAAQLRLEGGGPQKPGIRSQTRKQLGAEGYLFAIVDSDGEMLGGNAAFPRPSPTDFERDQPSYRNHELDGRKLRIVNLRYTLEGAYPEQHVVLQVAESTAEREALTRSILANIVIPQLLVMALAGLAIWYGVGRGLTPLKRLRDEVSRRPAHDLRPLDEETAPEEVRPLIHAVNELLWRLAAVIESQKRFVADAAHQLRTPFAGLKSQAELLLRESDPGPIKHGVRQMLVSAERCNHLVTQLLVLARNEPGALAAAPLVPVDLRALARDTAASWVPRAVDKAIDLGFEEEEAPLWIRGNGDSLREMINNLIDNAIRYTPAGGQVTVSVRGEPDSVALTVEDTGPGIALEHREKVFERFYRVLGSGEEGSGLGLAIVREVAQAHHAGAGIAEGRDGIGTVFTVQFKRSVHSEP